MKLFSCTVNWPSDDTLTEMRGFSHRGQPEKHRVSWYPFEQWRVRVWLYAKNRTHACRQLRFAPDVRDLDGGAKCNPPECMAAL